MEIKKFTKRNFEAFCEIYQQGIDTGIATFQTSLPSWNTWHKAHISFCRLGVFEHDKLIGWCALSQVSKRVVYKGVAEVSIYVHSDYRNKGVGKMLLQKLIIESEKNGIWTLQSGIFPENKSSIQLHLNYGFKIVGIREKIGQKDGIWKDNLLLERRSKRVGI